MQRFFVENINNDTVEIFGDEAHHIKNVLRKKIGDVLFLFDGKGVEYEAEIEKIRELEIRLKIISKIQRDIESKIKINLYQSLPKGRKFDFIVEKTTELGVSKIIPVVSERTIFQMSLQEPILSTRGNSKHARWQKIALSAAKQCGRTVIPEISPIQTFQDSVMSLRIPPSITAMDEVSIGEVSTGEVLASEVSKQSQFSSCEVISIIPWECEQKITLKNLLTTYHSPIVAINLFIGPEGGFSNSEIELAKKCGIISTTLGKRIFRSETAPIVVISNILYELEN
ncbi:MAG: 16S rRNA (uracil(1498)-N(3))-methyltransferase [Elusimicrobiota bacterium]